MASLLFKKTSNKINSGSGSSIKPERIEVMIMKMQQLVNYTSILDKFAELEKPAELPRLKFSEIARAY